MYSRSAPPLTEQRTCVVPRARCVMARAARPRPPRAWGKGPRTPGQGRGGKRAKRVFLASPLPPYLWLAGRGRRLRVGLDGLQGRGGRRRPGGGGGGPVALDGLELGERGEKRAHENQKRSRPRRAVRRPSPARTHTRSPHTRTSSRSSVVRGTRVSGRGSMQEKAKAWTRGAKINDEWEEKRYRRLPTYGCFSVARLSLTARTRPPICSPSAPPPPPRPPCALPLPPPPAGGWRWPPTTKTCVDELFFGGAGRGGGRGTSARFGRGRSRPRAQGMGGWSSSPCMVQQEGGQASPRGRAWRVSCPSRGAGRGLAWRAAPAAVEHSRLPEGAPPLFFRPGPPSSAPRPGRHISSRSLFLFSSLPLSRSSTTTKTRATSVRSTRPTPTWVRASSARRRAATS